MRAETLLAAAALVVVLASAVVAVAVPGAVAGPDDDPGFARLGDVTVATAEVRPDTATLTVTAFLQHRGGTSENLSVRVRATHLETGMHATTGAADVAAVEGDREVAVPVNVSVPREGGYRVEVALYDDGDRRGDHAREVRGVGDLRPPAARSPVRFHQFDRRAGNDTLPSVQTSVARAGDDEVTLNVSAYLTNEGGDATGDLSVQFVLRQAESGVVATRTRVPLGAVAAQHTVTPSALVTVPDGYNYYVDAILWRDGVVVDSVRGVANLDPERSIRVNRSGAGGGLQVSDFERDRDDAGGPTGEPSGTEVRSPGFGAVAALVALVAAALYARSKP
jgi:PGF-CTERM protein